MDRHGDGGRYERQLLSIAQKEARLRLLRPSIESPANTASLRDLRIYRRVESDFENQWQSPSPDVLAAGDEEFRRLSGYRSM